MIRFYNQNISVDGERIAGIQSSSLSCPVPLAPINALGLGFYDQEIRGEISSSFSIETSIVTTGNVFGDFFAPKNFKWDGGDAPVGITGALMSSYEFSAGVGQIVGENFSFSVFGDVDAEAGTVEHTDVDVYVGRPDGITLSLSEFSTQSVQSVTYTMDMTPQSRKKCGQYLTGRDYFRAPPFEVSISVEFDVKASEFTGLYDQICAPRQENIEITLANICDDTPIRSLSAENARLVNFSTTASIGENRSVTLEFKAFANSTGQAMEWLT